MNITEVKNTLSTTLNERFSTPMEQMPRRIINIPTTGLAVGRPVAYFQKEEFDQGSHDYCSLSKRESNVGLHVPVAVKH